MRWTLSISDTSCPDKRLDLPLKAAYTIATSPEKLPEETSIPMTKFQYMFIRKSSNGSIRVIESQLCGSV